jgi:hypothetical protein
MSRLRLLPPTSAAAVCLSAALILAPFGALAGLVLRFPNVAGVLGAIAAFWVLAHGGGLLRQRLAARRALAHWGSYVAPGILGEPVFHRVEPAGIRNAGWGEVGMGGPLVSDWILADGARISSVTHGLEKSDDGRYVAALTMAAGADIVVYDTVEHVRYEFDHPNAASMFDQLFRNVIDANFFTSQAQRRTVLDVVLVKARREPYFSCHGLWLPESARASCPARLLTRQLGPACTLTALLAAPDDLLATSSPWSVIHAPLRRLWLNGVATAFWCRDLDQAMLSDDGASLIVAGIVLDETFSEAGRRFYRWHAAQGWNVIDADIRDAAGATLGVLASIVSLAPGAAVFGVRLDRQEQQVGYIQTGWQAMPVKVSFDDATCRLPVDPGRLNCPA